MKWDEMSPRERDSLVAEKVMGWDVQWRVFDGEPVPTIPSDSTEIPRYTTDISAAYDVVEKFDGWCVEKFGSNRSYIARVYNDGAFNAQSKSAPEAICLAALRAVGVEVDDQ